MLNRYSPLLLDNQNLNEFDSYREEYLFLNEMNVKKAVKDVDKASAGIVKGIKNLYTTGEDHLLDNTMEFSKIITRAAIVGSTFAINPLLGLISAYTLHAVRMKNDAKKREKLIHLYTSKLEFVEDKIGKEDDDTKKLNLIKLKNKLHSDLQKIKVVKD